MAIHSMRRKSSGSQKTSARPSRPATPHSARLPARARTRRAAPARGDPGELAGNPSPSRTPKSRHGFEFRLARSDSRSRAALPDSFPRDSGMRLPPSALEHDRVTRAVFSRVETKMIPGSGCGASHASSASRAHPATARATYMKLKPGRNVERADLRHGRGRRSLNPSRAAGGRVAVSQRLRRSAVRRRYQEQSERGTKTIAPFPETVALVDDEEVRPPLREHRARAGNETVSGLTIQAPDPSGGPLPRRGSPARPQLKLTPTPASSRACCRASATSGVTKSVRFPGPAANFS